MDRTARRPLATNLAETGPVADARLAVLSDDPKGDELLDTQDVKDAILSAARSEFKLLRRPAVPLARRLGLLEPGSSRE